MSTSLSPTPVFCTVATASFLSQAATLAGSLQLFHPQCSLTVLVADQVPELQFEHLQNQYAPLGLKLVPLEQLSCPPAVLERMTFYYTAFELCCALRGLLHDYIWRSTKADRWIFLDSDIFAYAPLTPLLEELDDATLLLTPHRRKSLGSAHAPYLERDLLRGGLYNAGFVGVRRCPEAERFIQWFTDRLEKYALDDPYQRTCFADQLWLNLAPHSFEGIKITRHLGANVGHWNVFDGKLEHQTQSDSFLFDGQQLLFFHFSGWDKQTPGAVSRHLRPGQELPASSQPAWDLMAAKYAQALDKQETSAPPFTYGFAQFTDGRAITPWMRRHFYELCETNSIPFDGSPFSQADYFYAKQQSVLHPSLARRVARRLKHKLKP